MYILLRSCRALDTLCVFTKWRDSLRNSSMYANSFGIRCACVCMCSFHSVRLGNQNWRAESCTFPCEWVCVCVDLHQKNPCAWDNAHISMDCFLFSLFAVFFRQNSIADNVAHTRTQRDNLAPFRWRHHVNSIAQRANHEPTYSTCLRIIAIATRHSHSAS